MGTYKHNKRTKSLVDINDLLVMSVFGRNSYKWYNVQLSALNKTTRKFHHAVYLNNPENASLYDKSEVVEKKETNERNVIQHYQGLKKLISYARNSKYKRWLILDCDCFPIQSNWEDILTVNSAIKRYENFEKFSHPSAAYVVNQKISIDKRIGVNGDFKDLLRTNKINYHPVLYGVYYDIFYHHGAGSRDVFLRSDSYYNNQPSIEIEEDLFEFAQKLKFGIHKN